MQIYDLLKQDHEEVKALLTELVNLAEDDDYHSVLIDQIASALIPHSRAEESVFYNTIRAVDSDTGEVMHGYKEHIEAEGILRTLQALDKTDMSWKATAVKLKEALDHHVAEEESKIFAQGHRIFTAEEAESIGEAFVELKGKIVLQGGLANTFELVKNLMPPRLINKLSNFSASGRSGSAGV